MEGKPNNLVGVLLAVVSIAAFGFWLMACGSTDKTRALVVGAPTIPNAQYIGQDMCLGCHEDGGAQIGATVHGRVADFELEPMDLEMTCEACHGPGSIHAESGDTDSILNLGKLSPAESSAVCVQCHADGNQLHWPGSTHDMNDVACIEYHKVHDPSGSAMLAKSEPDLCFDCHAEQRMESLLPSHHPVAEGRMGCGDCHQPHGSVEEALLATDERLNDLCLNCHSSLQGPFVFEHAPVQESCNVCHTPHGSVANNLLVQNEPFLCLQCHDTHFHSGLSGDEGEFTTIYGRKGTSSAKAPKMTFLTKCTQCHSKVHGSNLPAQSVPDLGRGLTR